MDGTRMDVMAKVNEAEVYFSMGLLEESLLVYEKVLSGAGALDDSTRQSIAGKISEIKNEIHILDQNDHQSVTSEDIALFKETLSITDGSPETLDSAAAFMELGLFKEALCEYEKLFCKDKEWKDILANTTACLLKCCSSGEMLDRLEEIIRDKGFEDAEKADIKFLIGQELERRDLKALALEFYDSARRLDPQNNEIEKKLKSLSPSLLVNSKYDYLINQNKVTVQQLQKALMLSKQTGKSVELTLVDKFNIKIEDLEKSLSLYYNYPFRKYDPDLPGPSALIENLKKIFLLNNHWVPVSSGNEGTEVLIEDPKDLTKTDQIRWLLKMDRINFSVGIKEHIEAFIHRFYEPPHSSEA